MTNVGLVQYSHKHISYVLHISTVLQRDYQVKRVKTDRHQISDKKVREVILQQVCATASWTVLSCLKQQFHNIYYCLSNYRSCPSDIPYTCIANVSITVCCRSKIANSKQNCEALSQVGWTRSHLYRWEHKSTHKDSPGSRTSGIYV